MGIACFVVFSFNFRPIVDEKTENNQRIKIMENIHILHCIPIITLRFWLLFKHYNRFDSHGKCNFNNERPFQNSWVGSFDRENDPCLFHFHIFLNDFNGIHLHCHSCDCKPENYVSLRQMFAKKTTKLSRSFSQLWKRFTQKSDEFLWLFIN